MQVISTTHQPDILVTAPEGRTLLVVEVKRVPFYKEALEELAEYSEAIGPEFVMTVDPARIVAAPTLNGVPQWDRAITMTMSSILSHYGDVGSLERIEKFYLESLAEAWLRDLSFSWKFTRAPGFDELEEIGLASRLRYSETHSPR